MFLYNFVVEHWVISLLYIVLMWWIVSRFEEWVFEQGFRWYKRIYWIGIPLWGRSKLFPRACFYPFRLPLKILFLLIGYVFAIVLVILFALETYFERKEEKQNEKRRVEAAERQREYLKRLEEDNNLRALGRRDWFGKNKPKLYFNTVSGVTAVLRPADWEAAKRMTENAKVNELWEHTTLRPHRETFVFVTKSGAELVQTNDAHARNYKVAGWLSDLHDLCRTTDCQLLRDETIFVPWVNETLVPFEEQGRIIRDCSKATEKELIDKQAPVELQPVA